MKFPLKPVENSPLPDPFSDDQFSCTGILTLRRWECATRDAEMNLGAPSPHFVLFLSLSVTAGSVFGNKIFLNFRQATPTDPFEISPSPLLASAILGLEL